ncbi:hypothetical protein [Actinoplanes sp. L3-i22]|uniref:hypothetical protein n=1 Tax=Actinoplanes sp. L3-i22 TaxID=2836373 RepID=UPI001C751D2A|nr:hypothetical protein [Actinoplanes sp. L3-i22]BCY13454.1 hypothetical protein L3i22_085420 [Actinoplanes sp. L3-i22]
MGLRSWVSTAKGKAVVVGSAVAGLVAGVVVAVPEWRDSVVDWVTGADSKQAEPDLGLLAAPPYNVPPDRPLTCAAGDDPADSWTYTATFSGTEGLVVTDVRFGPRLVARRMSVPYLILGGTVGHLSATPIASDPDLTSVLVGDATCSAEAVTATYRVSSQSLRRSFLVRQVYRFDDYRADERCESSLTAQCVRFWPSVYWALEGAEARTAELGFDVVQRFDFDPDHVGTGAADMIHDVASMKGSVRHLAEDGALRYEDAYQTIKDGGTKEWENWHQTGRTSVGLPGPAGQPAGLALRRRPRRLFGVRPRSLVLVQPTP